MTNLIQYYGLNLLAPLLSIYAVYVLATHQAEKPIGGLRRRRSGILALLGANAIWLALGLMWTQVIPIFFVNVLFAVVYYRNYMARKRIRQAFATRQLSQLSNGIDVLC